MALHLPDTDHADDFLPLHDPAAACYRCGYGISPYGRRHYDLGCANDARPVTLAVQLRRDLYRLLSDYADGVGVVTSDAWAHSMANHTATALDVAAELADLYRVEA